MAAGGQGQYAEPQPGQETDELLLRRLLSAFGRFYLEDDAGDNFQHDHEAPRNQDPEEAPHPSRATIEVSQTMTSLRILMKYMVNLFSGFYSIVRFLFFLPVTMSITVPENICIDRHRVTVYKLNQEKRIATWNVRTMREERKLADVCQEMERMKISVLGLCEVRRIGSGEEQYEESKLIYSGGDKHEKGVGVLLSQEASKSLKHYWAISERVMLVKLQGYPLNINIIQAYAPTTDAGKDEIEDFYNDVDAAFRKCKRREVNIVMGDFNAKIGRGRVEQVVGPHGLGERNERGDRLVEWCLKHGQVVTNTWFKQHNRHLWTWQSPKDKARNQIDYITVNERFRNVVMQVKTYHPGAEYSDHVPVVATIRLNLKNVKKSPKFKPKRNLALLGTDSDVTAKCAVEVRNRLSVSKGLIGDGAGERWKHPASAMNDGARVTGPEIRRRKNKPWMSEEILEMTDKRRQLNGQDNEQYRIINRKIRQECNKSKEQWMNEQCQEVDELDSRCNNAKYKRIKEINHKLKRKNNNIAVKKKDETIVMKQDDMKLRWSEYIFKGSVTDDRSEMADHGTDNEGLAFLESEIEIAVEQMKTGKAAAEEGVTIEMLLTSGDNAVKNITKIANKVYKGQITEQMCKSVTVPEITGTLGCESHRMSNVMSQITKIVVKVLLNRIKARIKNEVADEGCGFVEDKNTSSSIFTLRMITERAIEKQKYLYLCFIDYENAFDHVNHIHLTKMLEDIGVDKNDLSLIRKLYWSQKASAEVNGEETEYQEIRGGVGRGCVLSHDLLLLYREVIMREIRDCEGIKISGQNINNLRYADDTILLADSEEKLQLLLDRITEESERRGLSINLKKTMWMIISERSSVPETHLRSGSRTVTRVSNHKYLDSVITEDAKCVLEIERRIEIAKKMFLDMRNLLANRKLSVETRKRMIKTKVWSTLLYGVESWTVSSKMVKKLEGVEIWLWRRMMNCPDRLTNDEVLNVVRENRQLIRTVRERQLKFLGHIMRRQGRENLALTGMIEGKRRVGGPREKYMNGLVKLTYGPLKPVQLMRIAQDEEEWRSKVSDMLEQC